MTYENISDDNQSYHEKKLQVAHVLIRNKSYINFLLAQKDRFYPEYCKKPSLVKLFGVIECCFQTSKADLKEKGHFMPRAKTSSIA